MNVVFLNLLYFFFASKQGYFIGKWECSSLLLIFTFIFIIWQFTNQVLFPGDYAWTCGNCMMPDPWERFSSPPLPGSHPTTPRNGCRPGVCVNNRAYPPNYVGKGTPRSNRGRNLPWAPNFGSEDRYKGQRCRNAPAPYW